MGPAKGVREQAPAAKRAAGGGIKEIIKRARAAEMPCRYAATRAAKVFIDMLAEKM
jgi:hypothetical protein